MKKMPFKFWLFSLLLMPVLAVAGSPTFSGHNVDLDPGIQVVDNPDGSALLQDFFILFNQHAPSNVLGKHDFTVKVDGNPVAATITPPNTSVKKMADIVFCMDVSGSMAGEINAIKNNTQSFVNKLSNQNIDVRLGLITFGQYPSPYLRSRNNGQFYATEQDFINEFGTLKAYGGTEEWFDCLAHASQYPYRSGAERITLLITDENGDIKNYTINSAITTIKNNASKVYGISYEGLGNVLKAINATNGKLYNIRDPFNTILDNIADAIINKYGVSLLTNVGPGTHYLHVAPIANDPGGEDKEPFKIGANPVVSLTQTTQDAINAGVSPGNVSLSIETSVTDDGIIKAVNIIWQDPSNKGTNAMSSIGANIYSHQYNGNLNINECFAFAIQAIDDEGRNITVPANQGNTLGGQWRICANDTPPVIGTISPDTYDYQQAVSVSVDITDDKSSPITTLKYRQLGETVWNDTPMTDNGGTFSATVPASAAGFTGIELEVVAQDTSSNVSTETHSLKVNSIPITIVDVTRHTDTIDTGPFSVHAVVVGLDLAIGGQVDLLSTVNGGAATTLSMTQAITGTSATMPSNSNIYVEKMPAVKAGDKVCYFVKASNPTNNVQSTEICFDVLQPADPLAITPNSAIMVVGDSASEFLAVGGYGTYSWTSLDGTMSTTLGDKTNYTPSLSGLDKLSITDLKGFAATAIIKVLPSLTIEPAINGKHFSPSSSIQLTATGAETPYQWKVDNAGSQVLGNDSETVEITLGVDPATITATVTDSQGRTQTVTFSNNGQLQIDPAGSEMDIAPDSETTLTVSGGDGNYTWTMIGGDVDDPNAASIKYKAPGLPGVYHLTVTDGNGDSASITMRAGEPFRVTPHCARIQRDEVATFKVVSGAAPYIWESNFGSLSATSGTEVTFTPEANIGLYEITVHDAAGATLDRCVYVAEGIVVTPTQATLPINGTLSIEVNGGNGTYTWNVDKGSVSPNSGSKITYTAENIAGDATITVRDTAGNTAEVKVIIGSDVLTLTPSVTVVDAFLFFSALA